MNLLKNFGEVKKMSVPENRFEHILQKPSGTKTEKIIIDRQNYELIYEWKRRIFIHIKPTQHLLQSKNLCEIRRMPLMSIIAGYPNYKLKGKRTELTERLLYNNYTPPLLQYPSSKLICGNNQINYSATINQKDVSQLEKILKYFEALVITSK